MPRYHTNSKEVLRDGKHFADCIDDGAARLIADALNERKGMPQTQPALPLDGADGPLFVAVSSGAADPFAHLPDDRRYYPVTENTGLICPSCHKQRQPYRECPNCTHTHTVRQENDEYACSCGKRWDIADGEEHP